MNTKFIKELTEPQNKSAKSFWFAFRENNLLVHDKGKGEGIGSEKDRYTIPLINDPAELNIAPGGFQYLGRYDTIGCYTVAVPDRVKLPAGMFFLPLIGLYDYLPLDLFHIAGYAFQIMRWEQTFRYCGRCGALTENVAGERAKICKKCNLTGYPRISPAVIVAVIKENQILLAKARRFTRDMHSVLAGFVEPGETLEECVKREVKEEGGIEVDNIRYFGSQPWPFPDSLMIGFIADYKSGQLAVDDKEITTAGWFTADNLPNLPGKLSIARELIDWFTGTAAAARPA